jgi:uncharacterized circularly permuted ATP-grasp superfamily protein
MLLIAIGLMPGDSVYKYHTFNKETAHIPRENSTYLHLTFIENERDISGSYRTNSFL